MIKYGYGITSFTPHWLPNKATNTTMPKAVEDLAKLGYEGIELTGIWNQQVVSVYGTVDKFKEHLRNNNMKLCGLYYHDEWHQRSRWPIIIYTLKQMLEFLKECECTNLIIGVPWKRNVGYVVRDKYIKNMAECLNRVATETLNYGVKPTVHTNYESLIEKRKELDKLMTLTEPAYVALCIDTAQLYIAGEDPLSIIDTYKDRINYFHFKDAREIAQRGTYWDKRYFYEVGQGKIDFPAIMKIMKNMKYKGWIVIECDHQDPTPTPYESAKSIKRYIEENLSKIYR